MARVWFCGFETGDFSECGGSSAGSPSVQSSTVRSGNYAAKFPTGASSYKESKTGLAIATTAWAREYIFVASLPSSQAVVFGFGNSGDGTILEWRLNTDGTVQAYVGGATAQTKGSIAVTTGQWNLLEFKCTIGAGSGVSENKVGGVTDVTSTSLTMTGPIDRAYFGPSNVNAGVDIYLDDLAIDSAAYCGAGNIVSRQFVSTTPTDNAFTKSTGSTIDTCWNDTPTSGTTNASSGTSAAAQTAFVSTFASTQSGHGTNTIGSSDTINAAKAGIIAKTSSVASSGNLASVRYRDASATAHDTSISLTVSDVYYESAIFTDTPSNLNSYQVGIVKGATTRTQTVEDAWLIVEYTPAVIAAFIAAQPRILSQSIKRASYY